MSVAFGGATRSSEELHSALASTSTPLVGDMAETCFASYAGVVARRTPGNHGSYDRRPVDDRRERRGPEAQLGATFHPAELADGEFGPVNLAYAPGHGFAR